MGWWRVTRDNGRFLSFFKPLPSLLVLMFLFFGVVLFGVLFFLSFKSATPPYFAFVMSINCDY
jgi:uncharacterized membrane protein SirB2